MAPSHRIDHRVDIVRIGNARKGFAPITNTRLHHRANVVVGLNYSLKPAGQPKGRSYATVNGLQCQAFPLREQQDLERYLFDDSRG